MSALCCCVSRRGHKQCPEPHMQGHVEYHQEPPHPFPRVVPYAAQSKPASHIEKTAQAKKIPFGTPAQLDDLIVDDDDTDTGDEPQPPLTRRASAALGAVRARFIRHLSSESNVKRQSTASVGKSQEECERRAELRRLRQKRIQNELQNDLRSERTTDQVSNASVKSVRHASLTSPSQSQPGGGPRDTIEFAVLDGNQVSPKNRSPAPSLGSKSSVVQPTRLSRQSSGTGSQSNKDDSKAPQAIGGVESVPSVLDSSKPHTQPLPHSDTRSTFRLSSSASWLDRIIGVDNTFSENGEHPSLDGRSALSIWIAAQGLRSRDNSMANLDPDKTVTGNPEHKDSKPCDEISIPATDVSRQSTHSRPSHRGSRQASPVRRTSFTAPTSHRGHVAEPTSTTDEGPHIIPKSPSEDFALDYAAALAFTSPPDNTSSQYASGAQSFQPSPSRSQPNLHHLSTQDFQDMQLSPFKSHDNPSVQRKVGRSEAQTSYATAQDHLSTTDLSIRHSPKDADINHDATDATAFSPSETASFQIREAELQTIEKRFAEVLSRRKPAPFNSRFKEHFSDNAEPVKKKPSLIPRLIHLGVPGRAKHGSKNSLPGSVEKQSSCLQKPSDTNQDGSPQIQKKDAPFWQEAGPRPGLKESATDLWQRAIRQEAEQRSGRSSRSRMSSRATPSKSSLRPKNGENSQSQLHVQPPGRQYLEVPQLIRAPSQSRWQLPRWTTPGNKKSELVHEGWPRLPMDLAVAPESWARYPAHDREERNTHARAEDDVKSQDFALRPVSSNGSMGWTTDMDATRNENSVGHRSASVQGKLGKAVKSGITKLFPFTGSIGEARGNSLGRRRGSFQLAGDVEYPELEVLPPGIGHIIEPEQITDTVSCKRSRASSHRSFGRRSSNTNVIDHRTSTSSFKQRERNEPKWTTSGLPIAARSVEVLPRTPLKSFGHDDRHSTPRTEVFVTPLSAEPKAEQAHDKQPRPKRRLPVAKSENILPFYRVHPGVAGDAGCVRSFTWAGSLSAAQASAYVVRGENHELQMLRRPGDLNASKGSFATGASFATAAAEQDCK